MSDKKIFICAVVLSSILFGLNYFHQAEIGIFTGRYLPLSESIRNLSYSYPGENSAATYPMWGYPALMAMLSPVGGGQSVLVFQYVLLLVSFLLIYRSLALPRWGEHLKVALFYGVIIAYGVLLSVKWPAAILAFLLLVFAFLHQRRMHGLASLILLLAAQFRSEALIIWVIYLLFLAIQVVRSPAQCREIFQRQGTWYNLFGVVACSIILVSCWPLYQYSQHKAFLLGASNSGGVLYRSLGQLPNNPWGRIDRDGAPSRYALSQGVENAWGLEGNRVVTRGFLNDIMDHPLGFVAKVLYNELSIVRGGLYVTEIRTLSVRGDEVRNQEQRALFAQYKEDVRNLLQDMLSLQVHTYTMLGQLLLKLLSMLLLVSLLITLTVRLVRRDLSLFNPYIWIIAGQFLIIGVYQYQARHVSIIVILFLFILCSRPPSESKKTLELSQNPHPDQVQV